MKRKFISFSLLLSAIFVFASCLGDSDDNGFVLYEDSALTSFSLGTLKLRVDTVTAKGKDTTYYKTLDCSNYKFYIDQTNRKIYNPDSLPYGVDGEKIICNVSSKNGGLVGIKSMTSDTINYFNSSDSIDFTKTRTFRVYNLMGTATRDYTISVNIHKEKANIFKWTLLPSINKGIGLLTGMKAVTCNGNIYVFGSDGTRSRIYSTAEILPTGWKELTSNISLDKDIYNNVAVKDKHIFAYSAGAIWKSEDGLTWTKVSDKILKQLVGASKTKLYAISTDNKIVSSADNGEEWTIENMDTDSGKLPEENINFFEKTLATNANTSKLVLMGTSESGSRTWGKVEENDKNAENQPWTYFTTSTGDTNTLPNLENLQVTAYDKGMMAMGGKGIGADKPEAFSHFYKSNDGGLTWHADTMYALPENFKSSATSFAFIKDSKNYLWIFCGGSGQIWRGRLNRLTWTEENKYFGK